MKTYKKLSFGFRKDDVELMEELKKMLYESDGEVSNITLIRKGLRSLHHALVKSDEV